MFLVSNKSNSGVFSSLEEARAAATAALVGLNQDHHYSIYSVLLEQIIETPNPIETIYGVPDPEIYTVVYFDGEGGNVVRETHKTLQNAIHQAMIIMEVTELRSRDRRCIVQTKDKIVWESASRR